MAEQARGEFGRIDILVNNAGVVRDNPVTFMKEDEWADVVDIDLKGAFFCIKVLGGTWSGIGTERSSTWPPMRG